MSDPEKVMGNAMLTTNEAVSRCKGKLDGRQIARLARRGKFIGAQKQPNGSWLIPEQALEQYVKQVYNANNSLPQRFLAWWDRASRLPVVILIVFFLNFAILSIDFLANTNSLVGTFSSWINFRNNKAKEGEILVVIADFVGKGGYDPTTRIYSSLYTAMQGANLKDARLLHLTDSPLTNEDAITLGKQYGASIVIWGTYDDAAIEPRFEITKEPKKNLLLPKLGQTINLDVKSFNIYMAKDLPSNYEYLVFLTLGQIYSFDNNFATAVDSFTKALQINLTGRESEMSIQTAYALRGQSNTFLQRFSEAIDDYQKSIELDPKQILIYNNMAGIYIETDQFKDALEITDRALKIDSKTWYIYHMRGLSYYYLKDYQKSVAEYEVALKYCNDEVLKKSIYLNRGASYNELRDFDDARRDYNEALRIDSNDSAVYQNLGFLELDSGHNQDALKAFDKAIELKSEDARAYQGRGVAYRNLNDYKAAMQDFNYVIINFPKYGGGYYERGVLYLVSKDYTKALEDFNKTIEIWPDNILTYKKRVIVLSSLRRYKEALADLGVLDKLAPSDAEVYIMRGITYNILKEFNLALMDFGKAYRLGSQGADVLTGLGLANAALGRSEEAIRDFTAAITIDERYAEAYLGRMEVLNRKGDISAAYSDCQQYVRLSKEINSETNISCAVYQYDK